MIEDVELRQLKIIINFVKDKYAYDFTDYAMSSFKRRIIRIFRIFHFESVDSLISKLDSDKEFVEKFVNELTVNTTEMFRDPSFWRKLRDEILPEINTVNKIRIWHAACSSGEEVYSMCILLKELGIWDKCQLVASDLNEDVLATAKNGVYYLRNMEVNEANYQGFEGKGKLADYYKQLNQDLVDFDKGLIDNVNFFKFDLVIGQQFSKFDLILCRNAMIYFNIELQNKVVELFENSLIKGGYLAVGNTETIAWCNAAKNFSTISAEEKIYKKLV